MLWVRWDQILASKNNDGLGVGILKAFNLALLQKWRWRLVTNPNLLWVSLVKAIHGKDAGIANKRYSSQGTWANIVILSNVLHEKGILPIDTLRFKLGNGTSIRFWKDAWIGESLLYIRYNKLFHLDNNENCLISDRITVTLTSTPDTWQWLLSKDGMFSDSDTRIHIDATTLPINSYVSLWSNLLPIKIESLRCPSCYMGIESADHIFFTCSLAKEVLRLIFRWVEFSAQQLNSFSDCRSWLG
ncbi:hypothetical protein Tco_1170678 [Tanacetum coccineum]